MAFNHFDYVPSTIDRKRSVFKYDKACARGAFIGFLYPICKPERMMPGSSISLNIAAEVRSGALVAPLMDEIIMDVYSFFVPNRIVWEHWKQFIGAVDDVLFNNLTQYTIPSFKFGFTSALESGEETLGWNGCIACHFGLPYPSAGLQSVLANCPTISALPFRGYTFIWNEFFRPEQLVAPQVINRTDDGWKGMNINITSALVQIGNQSYHFAWPASSSAVSQAGGYTGGAVLRTFRAHRSLWTSCLPNPSLETLNLLANLSAPVGFDANASTTTTVTNYGGILNGTSITADNFYQLGMFGTSQTGVTDQKVYADLSQALLTVNNYRETIMLQNYYDVLNRAGSRYDEIMYNIFGTRASNAVTDIPELITHKRFTIYRKEVVALANSTDADGNVEPIGNQAAYIDTVIKDNFFTRSTTEHGYIHMMYTIRPARIRNVQGVEPEWQQLDKMDLYYPQFDGMGDVVRYKKELYWNWVATEASQTGTVFGYQEYGADWKYQRNDAAGYLDLNCTTKILGYTLQESLSAAPTLIDDYISCLSEMVAFSECLALPDPTLAPQFVIDFRLTGTITHPMPVYNIPGAGALL